MELSQQIRPSLWYSLLWKDFQQIRSTFVAVASGVLVMQLMLLAVSQATGDPGFREAALGSTSVAACIAPILFAIGCSGMLIGHERQTGTWAWSSSLPVSWQQALGSKLVVSLSGSILMVAIAAVVPVALVMTGRLVVSNTPFVMVYVSGLTAIALLEVIACFFLASLLIRETLTALVVAGLALSLGQMMVSLAIVASFDQVVYETPARQIYGYIPSLVVVLVGGVAMTVVFHWRWGAGQQSELSLRPSSSAASAPKGTAYHYTSDVAPSEWSMLARHAFVNSWPMRLSVLISSLLLAMSSGYQAAALVIVATLSAGLFGLTAFVGDQTLERFHFLTDRGVSPWKLVASRLGIAAIWALPTVCIVATICFVQLRPTHHDQPLLLTTCALSLLAFLLSALAGLCFRKAVIAATVAFSVGIAWLSIWTATIDFAVTSLRSFGTAEIDFWAMCQLGIMWSLLAIFILLVAIFRLGRGWIVWVDSRLPLHFAWITTVAFLVPAFMAINSIFWLIPNVPWQGVPLSELSQSSIVVPDLQSLSEPQFPAPIYKLTNGLNQLYQSTPRQIGPLDSQTTLIGESLDQALSDLPLDHAQVDPNIAVDPKIAPTESAELGKVVGLFVSQLEAKLQGSSVLRDTAETSASLSDWIGRTAILAAVVSRVGQPALALRLWRINRDLQELAQSCDVLATANARKFAMTMLQLMSDSELKAMGDNDALNSFIPSPADERSATIMESKEWATFGREYLRGTVEPHGKYSSVVAPQFARLFLRFYLPARWCMERKLALDIQNSINYYSSQRKDYLTGETRDALLQRIARSPE